MSNDKRGLILVFNEDDGQMYEFTEEQLLHLQQTNEFPEGVVPLKANVALQIPVDEKSTGVVSNIKKLFKKWKDFKPDQEKREEYHEEDIDDDITNYPLFAEPDNNEPQDMFANPDDQVHEEKKDEKDPMDVGSLTFDDLFKGLPPEEYLDQPVQSEEEKQQRAKLANLIIKYNTLAQKTANESIIQSNLSIVRELAFRLDSGQRMCVHELIMYMHETAINTIANSPLSINERTLIVSFTKSLTTELIELIRH